ncbi:type VI secretion system ATPase TssH [Cupriavidus necator]|uniref:ATP-dependent protease Clp, ATPase subunit n=2 Tax=Bacteria TaxID=2 RepID=Q0JYG4_CUPNH|nr:type VI secretion system ATPase TssH [Cupriavidus necator]QCC04977.1 type VI secretion system ATPase TssH [Cupriavidus necator H16]QQB79665.1 type VI secretion system ATPase TssH [Cupriavidus necator]WKA43908.1 type VI secretion system ATPase TssH [Cupriavidus necator]CAJ97210.1 ATP-dependent protease Clp, ATPase subunit [Cupriavidus necator H16]
MDIDIRTLLSRLNPECRHAMEQAAQLCVRQTHYSVDVEHLLLQLLEGGATDLQAILAHFDLAPAQVVSQLQKAIDGFKRGNGRTPALSPNFSPLFQEAWLLSSMLLGEQQVRAGTLLLALLEVESLRGMLLESAPALLRIPRAALREALPALLGASAVGGGPGTDAIPAAAATPAFGMPQRGPGSGQASALEQFTVDLTALARAGAIDPVRGRDSEIRQLIDVLLRRRQNNPILTGEAGVGKTAVVEGFAQRIVSGDVPPALRQVSVRSLDLALLQAGAGVKGEFENRLKSVIAEVAASPVPVILFIDEAHQLIGAGGSEGQGDAANLLKPALARGELRTIAATTWAEYKKYIERDPALARRFQIVKVDEPAEAAAVDMLRGMVRKLEAHHGVEILDDAVRDAVKLSHRYVSGRQLPDKAISVLDTACARVAAAQSGVPEAIEALGRSIESAENQLRILRHEAATGTGRADEIAAVTRQRDEARAQHARLSDKLATEKLAVEEILAWRRRIAAFLEKESQAEAGADGVARHEDDDNADSAESLGASLARLEKGLEAVQNDEPMVPVCVDSAAVAEVISGWTGVPVGRMLADELHTVLYLQDKLGERVVGQDEALDAIARRIRTFRADLDDPGKPVGVFLLVGPSGVGKTETAHALADLLYGGERNMITVNMSEFQEAHSVSGLKGAPPGYVGYGRGGVLTEAVRRRPYSVVLLDEMEKAHPDVLELFFQVFDKGVMEDGEGVPIDFRNTVILLTSNAAQDVITEASRGGRRPPPQELVEKLRPALLRQFSPAFLARLVLVPYYHLGDAQIRNIVDLKLARLAQRFARNHNARLSWDEALAQAITQRCTEVDSGARNVDHILTQSVLPELARRVLEQLSISEPFGGVHLSLDTGGGVAFRFLPQAGC